MGLNARQRRFVDEYLIDLNATQAAIRSGYSKKTAEQIGSRLLRNVQVAAEIKIQQAKRTARVELNQDWVLAQLRENTERAMQAIPVMIFDPVAKRMVESGEWQYEGAVANRAVELIGKHLGMFTDKHEHTFPDLAPADAANRIAAILNGAKARKSSNGNGVHAGNGHR